MREGRDELLRLSKENKGEKVSSKTFRIRLWWYHLLSLNLPPPPETGLMFVETP